MIFLSGHCFLTFLWNLHSLFLLAQELHYVSSPENDIFIS